VDPSTKVPDLIYEIIITIFFFRTDYMIPQTFTVTSSIGCFYFLVFLFYN